MHPNSQGRHRLSWRVHREADVVDASAAVLGATLSAPILVAPVSLQRMICPAAETASAIAAQRFGTVFCLSMNASCSPEEVAAAAPSCIRWMQLYLLREPAVTESVLRRAEATNFSAIVVTVDVPLVGRRERDVRNHFKRLETGAPCLLRDPVFMETVRDGDVQRAYDAMFPNPTVCWQDIERLRALSKLPLVVKGILRADDARRAVEAGASAIVVSNHGGRQFDRAPATIDVLPEIVAAVGGDVEVYLDSGVRRGTDVIVALALGARAVLVGRPVLWGAAVGGMEGALDALRLLASELTSAMGILGTPFLRTIDPSIVRRSPAG